MKTALVRTGVVTVCCGGHRPAGCCADDCTPCCPECVTCPEVHLDSSEHRAAAAIQVREQRLMALVLADRARHMPALAEAERLVNDITRRACAAVDGVAGTEAWTRSVVDAFAHGFEQAAREALRCAEARDRTQSHMEGSVA
ncbi:hypothetical protein [Lentzea sp. NPDC092896]|uniref:hypothetical protein n=1 Tax=Lentzea sp. NPDC092896 TaxID=3364127 RepID=UPI0037F4953B